MKHWFILIRATGDLIYLAAALFTLGEVLTDRVDRRGNDTEQ
jgi:hypothetical protein